MYYFEVRFNEKNKEKAFKVLHVEVQKQNILYSFASNYYICYRLENPIAKPLLDKLKANDVFYFVCHYKL